MAHDMVELMRDLGHPRFRLVGHDRGGRVAHRLCLDHPDAVSQLAVLDISPTRTMYARTDQAFATAYYHWFFLIQPFDLPERLIGADPAYYLQRKLGGWGTGLAHFDPRALAEYERCFSDPATIHATCEDYRAAASIDLEHDAASESQKIALPAARAVGRAAASCIGSSSRSTTGAPWPTTCAGARCLRPLPRGGSGRTRRCASSETFFAM